MGAALYQTPGTYTFIVPAYQLLTAQVWGPGGGGGAGTSTAYIQAGGSWYPVQGSGGGGGTAASQFGGVVGYPGGGGGPTDIVGGTSTPGAPGGAAGGNQANTTGGGIGGGAGGASEPSFAGAPGGNGGAGGFAQASWSAGQLGVGGGITVVVGGGGYGGPATTDNSGNSTTGGNEIVPGYAGGSGAYGGNGQVYITWTDPPPPQPVAVDPVTPAYTYFLMHGENTFGMDSTHRHNVYLSGGAFPADGAGRIGYRSVYVPPGGSISLDYSGDFAYGTGDFTIEAWIYFTGFSNSGYQQILYEGRSNDPNSIYLGIVWNGSANVVQYYQSGGKINSGSIAAGWHHIALCRAQGYTQLFIDGATQAGLYTDTFNIVAHTPTIAGYNQGGPAFYVDEYRISRAARYVANFTPYTTPFPPYDFDATPLATSSPVLSAAPIGLPGLTKADGNTVLLMHCEGLPLSTLFADLSGRNHAITSSGGARVNTAPAAKFGVGLAEFAGTPASYLSLDSSPDFAFGTGDFTIEAWIMLAVLPSSTAGTPPFIIYDSRATATDVAPLLFIDGATNKLQFAYDGTVPIPGTTVLTTGVWYHVAVVRAAGVSRLYLSGAQEGPSYTDANNYIVGAGGLPRFGASIPSTAGCFNGYMDEIRVSRVARWTTNFPVPASPYPPYQLVAQWIATASPFIGNAGPLQSMDGNTVLLLHCDGFNGSTVVPDTSGRNHPVTVSGNAKLSVAQERFGSASLNLDGLTGFNGTYLKLDGSSDFAFGTGDFTVDLWINATSLATTQDYIIIDFRDNANLTTNPGIQLRISAATTGIPVLAIAIGATIYNGVTALAVNTWYHAALVRSASVTNIYLNGVQEGASLPDTNNYGTAANLPFIGLGAGGGNPFVGYLDEIRVSKGVARWAANFSPPTSPYSYLFYPTNLTTASPHFSPTGMGGSMSGLDLETGSPTFTAPALKSFWAIPAALNLVTGSPVLGIGYPIGVLHASALVTGSPDFKVDPILQQHPQILHADDLVPQAPDLGTPGRLPQLPVVYPPDMDRHVRRSGDDYAQVLIDLLPRGQAWPRDPGSTMIRSLVGLAEFYGFVDGRAADLLERESDPRATLELLPDWERNWGLPDPCFKETTTIGERRDMLVMKMTLLGGQSRLFFYSVAAWMGYQILIEEYSPFMVGISQVGDTSALSQDHVSPRWQIGRPEMRFYWTIHVTNASLNWFRASQGQAGVDPHLRIGLFIDQDCLFNRWKPAHTEIVYDYSNLKPGHSMDGTP